MNLKLRFKLVLGIIFIFQSFSMFSQSKPIKFFDFKDSRCGSLYVEYGLEKFLDSSKRHAIKELLNQLNQPKNVKVVFGKIRGCDGYRYGIVEYFEDEKLWYIILDYSVNELSDLALQMIFAHELGHVLLKHTDNYPTPNEVKIDDNKADFVAGCLIACLNSTENRGYKNTRKKALSHMKELYDKTRTEIFQSGFEVSINNQNNMKNHILNALKCSKCLRHFENTFLKQFNN